MSDETPRITQTVFASHSKALYARLHVAKHATSQRNVPQILSSARPASSLWIALSHWWMHSVSVCSFSGDIRTPFDYEGLFVCCRRVVLSRGYQIHYRTVFVCNVSFVGLRGLRVLCRLPITNSQMLLIWKSLNVHLPDHCMFWAACTLGYFGFLRAGEFTLPNLASFSSLTHLTV